eukprot:4319391-Amphidinium_carterae.1
MLKLATAEHHAKEIGRILAIQTPMDWQCTPSLSGDVDPTPQDKKKNTIASARSDTLNQASNCGL